MIKLFINILLTFTIFDLWRSGGDHRSRPFEGASTLVGAFFFLSFLDHLKAETLEPLLLESLL
jgi:hypothetical protein